MRILYESSDKLNDFTANYYQLGQLDLKERVALEFLVAPISSMAFSVLRT